ncbi:MAG: thioredoxin family protein [Haloferacaceae archaeon]
MGLDTMEPDPAWDAAAHAGTVEALGTGGLSFLVWGGDWCPDCRRQLPAFAAALDAAGVPDGAVTEYAVEKRDDGSKVGPGVEAYGIERIPTVVVERDGREVARFVEEEPVPIATYLAERLREAGADA